MTTTLFNVLDALLIAPFRWFDLPEAGFFLGVLILAFYSVAIGWLCGAGMERVQRSIRVKHEAEASKRSELAIQALQLQDKTAYLAQNTLAKDAYGHTMALAVGRITATLWPAVAALAWLDLRFREVPLPLPATIPGLGDTVFYPFYFIPIYFLVRFLWATVHRKLRTIPALPPDRVS